MSMTDDTAPAEGKISTALLRFAEPLWKPAPGSPRPSPEDLERAISLASLIWNVVVVGGATAGGLDKLLPAMGALVSEEGVAEMESMIKRKKKLFGDDNRLILDTRVRVSGDEFTVDARSVTLRLREPGKERTPEEEAAREEFLRKLQSGEW
jgi:hypothetical protein